MKIILMHITSFMTKLLAKVKVLFREKSPLFFINLFFLLAVLSFFNLSCTKYPSEIGANLMPNNSLSMHLIQDTDFTVYSKLIDTTRTDHMPVSFLGSMKDPVFGLTNASFYSKIRPLSTGPRFGTNPQVDSLILQLSYVNVYGDTATPLRVHVYEMKDNISIDSIYYSNKKLAVYPTDYANEIFYPNKNNYYVIRLDSSRRDTVRGVLRLNLSHLSKALGEKLLTADTTILDSTALFMNYFKGLYVKVDPVNSGGALVSFDLNTSKTMLMLYYHNNSKDSLTYTYRMSQDMAKINRYQHDYSSASAAFKAQVINGDTALGVKQFYLQGLGGVKTIIRFPHIRDLNKLGKVGVNEAKLILPGVGKSPYFSAPPQLSLIKIENDSTNTVLPDSHEDPDYFGGMYNANDNSYSFRITRYIESLIKDSTAKNCALMLYINSGAIHPQRFVFNGPQAPGDSLAHKARLNILYTIVK